MNSSISIASGVTLFDALFPGLTISACLLLLLSGFSRENAVVRVVAIGLSVFFMWRYMFWRIGETLPPPEHVLEYSVGILFIVVEGLAVTGATLTLFWKLRVRQRSRSQDADEGVERLFRETDPPLIDVFICTYNEGQDIVEPTILGALDVDYPNKRVWVLDDGRRHWLRGLCEATGCGYITRTSNEHAKAGNINNALKHISGLDKQPEYIAVLDADFVCQKAILMRTLALMHFDKSVAVVQTPQHFFNPDPIQRNLGSERVWPDEQRYFFDFVLAAKDEWDAAFCCGTSALIRFDALHEVGGMPTESVTEDYLLSLCLRERGYKTIYLNERLSVGLAPEGVEEYLTQRARWCLGSIQIIRGPHGLFSMKSGLAWINRLTLIDSFLYWSATPAFRVLAIIVPAIYLLFGIQSVYAGLYDAIDHAVPYILVAILTNGWLTDWRILPVMSDIGLLISAHTAMKSVCKGLFFPQNQRFNVTPKGRVRSTSFIHWKLLTVFLSYLGLTAAAIVWAFVIRNDMAMRDSSTIALIWCWYNSIVLILACLVCIDDPRQDIRINVNGKLEVSNGRRTVVCNTIDVSMGGVRLAGPCPFESGAFVSIGLGREYVDGMVLRATDDDFTVGFVHRSDQLKKLLLREAASPLITGRLHPAHVAHAIVGRIFR